MTQSPLILVVDDEIHILHVLGLKLERAGYRVLTAEDGEEALTLARRERPDAILSDYQMPFMTGLDLAMALSGDEATAPIPVIVLTARGFTLAPDHLEKTNIHGVITKPFSPREVLDRVVSLVGPAAQEQAPEEVFPS
jgi:CheY-like chemotaxis protein